MILFKHFKIGRYLIDLSNYKDFLDTNKKFDIEGIKEKLDLILI